MIQPAWHCRLCQGFSTAGSQVVEDLKWVATLYGFFLNTKNYAVLEKTGRGVIWVEKRWSML
jgi:hypothetical protein